MTKEEIKAIYDKVFRNNFAGEEVLKHLEKTFLDRPTYEVGFSFDQTAFREGQKNVISQIIKILKD